MTIDMRKPEDRGIGPKYRAFVNGLDVSRQCFYASEEEGIAHLYITAGPFENGQSPRLLHRATPKPKPNAWLQGGVWAETLTGTVELKKVA